MAQAAGRPSSPTTIPRPTTSAASCSSPTACAASTSAAPARPTCPRSQHWWGKNRIGAQGTEGFAEVLTNGGWRAVTTSGIQTGDGAMNYDLDMPPYIQEMADWLDDGKVHPCNFENAYAGFEIMMAMRSAARGGQVALPLPAAPTSSRRCCAPSRSAPAGDAGGEQEGIQPLRACARERERVTPQGAGG